MVTLTLAIDAIKYVDGRPKRDHLLEALELSEFLCYMYPSMKPMNRAILFHVISDLLGLLMYGVPKKSKKAIEALQTINYSEKEMDIAPVKEVLDFFKENVYEKKHGSMKIIEGFIKKLRIEVDILERYSHLEKIFYNTKEALNKCLPILSRFYEVPAHSIRDIYDRWLSVWCYNEEKEKVIYSMVERLFGQAEKEYKIHINRTELFHSLISEKGKNRQENELFSKWYSEGVKLFLKI